MQSLQLAINQQRQQQQQQQQQQQLTMHNQLATVNHQQLPAIDRNQQDLGAMAQSNWQASPAAWQQQFNATGAAGGNVTHLPKAIIDSHGRFVYQLPQESGSPQRSSVNENGLPQNDCLSGMSYDGSGIAPDALEVGEIRMSHGQGTTVGLSQGVGISHGTGGNTGCQMDAFAGYTTGTSTSQFTPTVNHDAMNSLANSSTMPSVDNEILMLRNHLVEKSQEILELMKELEQAYGLIHQLKEQNNFFSRQWSLYVQQHQQQPQQQAHLQELILQQKSMSNATTTTTTSTSASSNT